ncbi:MAG: hypothetical protein IKX07_02800, partial [Bacteroidales bacterium]|nr:hypothetical protein [Bacteroidales bacterium]
AGLITAGIDEEISREEVEHIIRNLAGSNIFPKLFLDEIAESDVSALFEHSVNDILEINPGLKPRLLEYMIGVVLADKEIGEKEVNFIYGMGESLGLSVKETSIIFAELIQHEFDPSLASIS